MNLDAAVIGGGVVGLAVLRALAEGGREAVLFERHDAFGRETSSRNSEVIHGGMYYPPGSLDAELCVKGRRLLYKFAARTGVKHKKCGKIIVATDSGEEEALDAILRTGGRNDVENLHFIPRAEIAAREPNVKAVAALLSPETGIVDAHGLMHALAKEAESLGGVAVRGAEVTGLERLPGGWRVVFRDADGADSVTARVVVNAAGLSSQKVMRMAGIEPERHDLRLYPCKGNYFSLAGAASGKISGLVYPIPEANRAGLGVHTTVDLVGRARLGPDVEYIQPADEYDYRVAPGLLDAFLESAGKYLPFLDAGDLSPDFSGIRPKLSGPGQAARGFYIAEETEKGAPGFVNLAGIESPGLTASLAVAEKIVALAGRF